MDKKFGHKPLIITQFSDLTIEQSIAASAINKLELEREREICKLVMLTILLEDDLFPHQAMSLVALRSPISVEDGFTKEDVLDFNKCIKKLDEIEIFIKALPMDRLPLKKTATGTETYWPKVQRMGIQPSN